MARTVAVIGAGLMGSGIAQVAAQAGWNVRLRDVEPDALDRAIGGVKASLQKFAAKGRIPVDAVEDILARIAPTTELVEAVEDADVVVEAVFEDVDVKRDLFSDVDRLAKADAVLATNTSAIPITQIASATKRPESVIGTHFFSPVPLMELCEIVRGYKTSDEILSRARSFAVDIGKTVVVVNRDIAGFITTRLLTAFVMEAVRLVESGVATAEDIDAACRLGFNHRMGPLATCDLTGADILKHASQAIYAETGDEKFLPPELLNRMVSAGDLGRKTGNGFYSYET